MRDAPATSAARSPSPETAPRATWPWALASILAVVLVLGGTMLARAVTVATTPPTVFAPPALPALDAVAVAHPEAGASLVALDSGNGHLVALAAPREGFCPPVGACPAPPAPDAFVVIDGHSGQTLASTPLGSDPATGAQALLADAATHRAYAVAPQAVTIYSTDNGARIGGFALPTGFASSTGAVAAALDSTEEALALATGQEALLVRADSGQVIAQAALPVSGMLLDGPVVDPGRGRLYLLLTGLDAAAPPAGQPQLVALDAHNLRALGQYPLPSGARLGPLDAPDANLAVFGADGTTWRLPLDALTSLPSGSQPALTAVPALRNALAVGENPTLGHHYLADAGETRVLASSGAIGALPLAARSAPAVPLMVDPARGLLYLPADHGAIVIVQDSASATSGRALTPTAAVLLAQATLASTWPQGQDPPFLTPAMFPVQAGTRAQAFWFDNPNHGWQGPFAGQTTTQVTAAAGGSYQVTLTVTWDQLFPHQHAWVLSVAPGGGVRLASSNGDVVP